MRGFLNNGKLDLNGWVHVRSALPLSINRPLSLASHGGIVLERGNIEISETVRSDGDKYFLNLVTLAGDISVLSTASGKMNLGLTANGQVRIAGSACTKAPEIIGNIAMRQIKAGSLSDSMARGVDLIYCEQLAARPFRPSENGSEKPLLTFSINRHPRLIQ